MGVPGAIFPYPVTSTDTAWKAAKTGGLRDKWNTELGLALRNAEATYKRIDFALLVVAESAKKQHASGKYTLKTEVDVAKATAEAHYRLRVVPAIAALTTAHARAVAAGKALIISKSSNTKAKAIAAELKIRLDQLKGINFDDFDAYKATIDRNMLFTQAQFGKNLKSALKKGEDFIEQVQDDPTPATFNAGIQGAARDITQLLRNVEIMRGNGIDIGKPTPTTQLAGLVKWAQGQDKLPVTANRTKVMTTILKYDGLLKSTRAWWGA